MNDYDFTQTENTGHFFYNDIFKYHHVLTISNGGVFGDTGIL